MNIEEAVTKMRDNLKHGSLEVECPACGKTLKVEWKGNWEKRLTATCLGDETGWLKWSGECGFVLDNLAVNTAKMDKVLASMPHARKSADELRDRRVGRSTLWPS